LGKVERDGIVMDEATTLFGVRRHGAVAFAVTAFE